MCFAQLANRSRLNFRISNDDKRTACHAREARNAMLKSAVHAQRSIS
jgi:hypothetical protein